MSSCRSGYLSHSSLVVFRPFCSRALEGYFLPEINPLMCRGKGLVYAGSEKRAGSLSPTNEISVKTSAGSSRKGSYLSPHSTILSKKLLINNMMLAACAGHVNGKGIHAGVSLNKACKIKQCTILINRQLDLGIQPPTPLVIIMCIYVKIADHSF